MTTFSSMAQRSMGCRSWTTSTASDVVNTYGAEELFIAIPSATGTQMQRISRMCEQTGVRYRTVPNLHDLLLGRVSVSQLREVNVEDLLGRDPVQLDLSRFATRSPEKSYGNRCCRLDRLRVCRQILAYSPAKLIVLDQAETPMFYLQLQLTKQPAVIGSCTRSRMLPTLHACVE